MSFRLPTRNWRRSSARRSHKRERTQWLAQLNPGRHRGGSPANKVTYRVSPLTGGLVREGGPALREGGANPLRGGHGKNGGRGDRPNGGGESDAENDEFSPEAATTAQERRLQAGSSKTNGGAMDNPRDASTDVASRERRYGDLNDARAEQGDTPLPYATTGGEASRQAGDEANEMSVKPKQERPKSLAETRGVNWGLAAAARSSNPITRPINIRCDGDKLLLLADKSNEPPVEVPLTQRTVESIDLLTAAVHDRIKTWGLAGRGMYWRPQLILAVGKSGEGRYADLEALLADSGFDVKRRR